MADETAAPSAYLSWISFSDSCFMISMGTIRQFTPVKLFIGVLVSNNKFIPQVQERLAAAYGGIDHRSDVIPFDFTNYYEAEMGDLIDRVFFSFERLIEADQLPEIKRQTNQLEDELAPLLRNPRLTVKRPVNLDPGYIEQAKVVLASTKNFYHRIYLGGGIFGEVTMHFKNNTYQFFPWTYPDYQSKDYQDFFLRMRQIFRSQLRTMCIIDRE
ncbi:MAG: DUF4416 domain-containing protein [Acidobacteria bacterium]|nr:MAG: DUF4416 domain-containing protein [Acidobacteriota bacterium]